VVFALFRSIFGSNYDCVFPWLETDWWLICLFANKCFMLAHLLSFSVLMWLDCLTFLYNNILVKFCLCYYKSLTLTELLYFSEMERAWFLSSFHQRIRFQEYPKCWLMNLEQRQISKVELTDCLCWELSHQYNKDSSYTTKVVMAEWIWHMACVVLSVHTSG